MKRITLVSMVMFTVIAFTACDGLLDLEPQASISDDVALSTPGNVETAVVGGYAALSSINGYGGSYIYLTDIYAAPVNEVFFNGTFLQPREVNTKQILIDNSFIAAYWSNSYNLINRANNILSALDVFGSGASAVATRNRVEAEAKFLRGVAYYNLVQAFGRAYNDGDPATNLGVPIVLTPTRAADASLEVPRNTVQEVYNQVVQDLTEARDALPGVNGFFANTYTASAFLSRVYLAMGQFSNAGTEADRVIQSGNYSLFGNIASNYIRAADGSETIFAMQNTPTDFRNDMAVFYAPQPFGRADIQVRDDHLLNYEAGDVRGTLFVDTPRGRMTTKYASDNPAVDSRRTNITVIRLAEMHLVRAEANFRLTGSAVAGIGGVTPEDDVNAIRARVGLAATNPVTLADVLQERRNELMFEGVMLLDLKRLQGTTYNGSTNLQWNDPLLVFPIPEREMNVNPNLVQNEAYL